MKKMNLQRFTDDTTERLVLRADRVSFMNTATSGTPSYKRMTGFTTMSKSKNPSEYSRKYVDQATENSDVTGYAEAVEYQFDMHTNNAVHTRLASISDDELTGSDALVQIVTVDMSSKEAAKPATMRTYSVIPDKSDDGTDALTYGGNFKAASTITKGTVTLDATETTATFLPAGTSQSAE